MDREAAIQEVMKDMGLPRELTEHDVDSWGIEGLRLIVKVVKLFQMPDSPKKTETIKTLGALLGVTGRLNAQDQRSHAKA